MRVLKVWLIDCGGLCPSIQSCSGSLLFSSRVHVLSAGGFEKSKSNAYCKSRPLTPCMTSRNLVHQIGTIRASESFKSSDSSSSESPLVVRVPHLQFWREHSCPTCGTWQPVDMNQQLAAAWMLSARRDSILKTHFPITTGQLELRIFESPEALNMWVIHMCMWTWVTRSRQSTQ